jgi:cytochrome c peroxidase
MRRICSLLCLAAGAAAGCSGPVLPPTDGTAPATDAVLQAINADYVASVKPLFARSCASCHGAGKALPWYQALPLVRRLIDDDVARARRTVDMSHDFPFRGRGSPSELLDAIGEVIAQGSMPPWRYRALHWGSAFSAGEKNTIGRWVERSQLRLRDGAR